MVEITDGQRGEMSMSVGRMFHLMSMLPRRPREFADRVANLVEVRMDRCAHKPDYPAVRWDRALDEMEIALRIPVRQCCEEPELAQIEEHVRGAYRRYLGISSIPAKHNGDIDLARLCYIICRAVKPRVVIETGVAHGVSSAFVLQALHRNGAGRLYSIDLPPLRDSAREYVGAFVPDELRERWELRIGQSRRLLPDLVGSVENVDVFLHDSLHTYKTIGFELETVWPRLSGFSAVIADDIEGNAAFADFVRDHPPAHCLYLAESEKRSICGVGVYRGEGTNERPFAHQSMKSRKRQSV